MQLVGIGPWEGVGVKFESTVGRGAGVHEKYSGRVKFSGLGKVIVKAVWGRISTQT
jgi:hypothetical protein